LLDSDTKKIEQADYELLCAAVREAGAVAMQFFGNNPKSWAKADKQPVSEADIAVNAFLAKTLRPARPDYGWLSEENEDDLSRLTCQYVWLVDPIDGTRAFLQSKPEFTISVALVEKGRPILGAVYNPAQNAFFHAARGQGTKYNGQTATISKQTELENCHMCAYAPTFANPAWPQKWPPMQVQNPNSVAYRLALVANGTFDAMMSLNSKHDWDIAAGDLLIHEAGGRMQGADRQELIYNRQDTLHSRFVAGTPALVDELAGRIKQRFSFS